MACGGVLVLDRLRTVPPFRLNCLANGGSEVRCEVAPVVIKGGVPHFGTWAKKLDCRGINMVMNGMIA